MSSLNPLTPRPDRHQQSLEGRGSQQLRLDSAVLNMKHAGKGVCNKVVFSFFQPSGKECFWMHSVQKHSVSEAGKWGCRAPRQRLTLLLSNSATCSTDKHTKCLFERSTTGRTCLPFKIVSIKNARLQTCSPHAFSSLVVAGVGRTMLSPLFQKGKSQKGKVK